jgi:hypothetical protein
MTSVILQPCADQRAFDHFQRTISSEVPIRDFQKYLSDKDWKKLQRLHPKDVCRVWGTSGA